MTGLPRVLVVDDEPHIVRGLKIILRGAGYAVEAAETKAEALAALAARPPDALVLDLVLPDGEGVEVCQEVRQWSRLPILVLSAIGDEREKVRALDAGADDYVTKPFGTGELLARLRAVMRRSAIDAGGPTIEIGELAIDLADRLVTRAGEPVHLTPINTTSSGCWRSTTAGSSPIASCCARSGGPSTRRKFTTSECTWRTSAPSSNRGRRRRAT